MKIKLGSSIELAVDSVREEYNAEFRDNTNVYAEIVIRDENSYTIHDLKELFTPDAIANIEVVNDNGEVRTLNGYKKLSILRYTYNNTGFEAIIRLV